MQSISPRAATRAAEITSSCIENLIARTKVREQHSSYYDAGMSLAESRAHFFRSGKSATGLADGLGRDVGQDWEPNPSTGGPKLIRASERAALGLHTS